MTERSEYWRLVRSQLRPPPDDDDAHADAVASAVCEVRELLEAMECADKPEEIRPTLATASAELNRALARRRASLQARRASRTCTGRITKKRGSTP